jgi:2-oxoglutarate dehydrogenase complex dehydrogenase (E1) component-like enzyme
MGAWRFVGHNLVHMLPDGVELVPVARVESASPATGSARMHEIEQQNLLDLAFARRI